MTAAPRGRGRHKGAQPIGECGARLARKIDRLLAEIQGAPPPAAAPEATAAGDQPEERCAPPAEAAPSAPGALEPATAESATAELPTPAAPEALAHQIGDHREPGPEPTTTVAAGDLANALVIAGSSAPEHQARQPELQPLAEPAMADQHQPEAAAQADLEPEPAEPLPVSIHSAAAVPETQAIAAALEEAWLVEHPAPATAAAMAELSPRARAIAELGAALLQGGQTVTLPAATAAELLEALLA